MSPRRQIVGTVALVGIVGGLLVLRLLIGRTIAGDGGVEVSFGLLVFVCVYALYCASCREA